MENLSKAYFFRGMAETELEIARSITRILEADPGVLLLREGQTSETLYIVRTGSVRVILPTVPSAEPKIGVERPLINLGVGECFGEFSLIDQRPCSATIKTNEPTTVYALLHRDLQEKLLTTPTAAAMFYKSLLTIVIGRLRSADAELALAKSQNG